MEWILFAIAMAIYVLSCWLGYNEDFRKSWYYYYVGLPIGFILSLIWFVVIRNLDDNDKIYFFSIAWDVGMVLVYFLMPLLFFGVRLDKFGVLGLAMIVGGMVLLKVRL